MTGKASSIEETIRSAHAGGVNRSVLEPTVATVADDAERARLEQLLDDLYGSPAPAEDAAPAVPVAQAPARRLRSTGNGNQPAVPSAAAPEGAVPPQNRDAEEAVLGAMLLSPGAIAAVREVLDAGDFYLDSHAKIYRAAVALADTGAPVDPITLAGELERRGELDRAGGRVRIHELARLVPPTANARHYAELVRDTATLRGLIRVGGEIAQLGWEHHGEPGEIVARALSIAAEAGDRVNRIAVRERLIPGGRFILDGGDDTRQVWGDGDEGTAWAAGEGLMVVGPQGVGKTTLMQQLALARCGLLSRVLGMDVTPGGRRTLYIAADRPAQARSSLRRMVADHNRDELDDRLIVHAGPPDLLVDHDPRVLLRLCEQADADTVVVDSVKDVVLKPTDEESAAKANIAWQHVIAAGVELVLGHHQRKGTEGNRKPDKLDDVYGNQRLYSGLGSVVLLWGDPGASIVEFKHLKQPREELGPWNVLHDHNRGLSTVEKAPDALDVIRQNPQGLTASAIAATVLGVDQPSRNEVEKIRRRLERLTDSGRLQKIGGSGRSEPPRYVMPVPGGGG